jgi:3-hydroxyisobutyrate dehydrogenase-like beta-hydroxyacid dehydrogenase
MSADSTVISGPVAVLGQGIIGSRVTQRLRQAGVEVMAMRAREAQDSAAWQEVACRAALVQIFLRDDEAVLQAIERLCAVAAKGLLVLNHATISHRATLQAARRCAESGLRFLDAPFTGSRLAAEQGQLCYYVGGDPQALAEAEPWLAISSNQRLPVGGIGDATVLKIVTNLITAVTVKALSEAAAITKAMGLPLDLLRLALENNANYSKLIGMKLGAMASQDFTPHFSLVNMLKDADFARELAAASGVSCAAIEAAAQALRRGKEAGLQDQDFSVISTLD